MCLHLYFLKNPIIHVILNKKIDVLFPHFFVLICWMQATKDIERTTSQESEFVNQNKETAKKCDPTLAMKHGQNGSVKTAPFMLSAALPARRGSGYLKLYAVSIYLVIILSVVFLGMWICPRLHAVHG